MRNEFPSSITVDGITLTLCIERKSVKNINARLRDSVLRVSVPLQASRAVIDSALPDLARRLLRRRRARLSTVRFQTWHDDCCGVGARAR